MVFQEIKILMRQILNSKLDSLKGLVDRINTYIAQQDAREDALENTVKEHGEKITKIVRDYEMHFNVSIGLSYEMDFNISMGLS